ncbi:MAG: putative O-glycosylation ligase, exosortase A system-associated [Burkholderiales bacterium]|nr:putative O-glycosylation ligase, exosortase A system-associated [Burkholderiales bacterium]
MRDIVVIGFILGLIPFILARAWIGVIAWTWIGLMNPHQLGWGFAGSFPVAMLVGAATLVALVFEQQKKAPAMNVAMGVLLVTAVFYTVKMPLAWSNDMSWEVWNKTMKIFLMTFVMGMVIFGEYRIKWLLWTVVFSMGFYGLKGGIFSIVTGGNHHVQGPAPSFISGNTEIGLAMNMVLPLILVAARHAQRQWIRVLTYSTFWFTIIAIVFTYSRGALLGLAVAMLFILPGMKRKLLLTLALVPVLIIGIVLTPEKLFDRAETIRTYEQDESAMQRIQAWGVAKNIAIAHPLTGGGFGLQDVNDDLWLSYADFLGNWKNYARAAHSIYFQVLGEHGFVGIALFLTLLFATLVSLTRSRRVLLNIPEARWLADYTWAVRIGIFAYIVSGAFLSLAYFDLLYLYVGLSAIIAREVIARQAAAANRASTARIRSPIWSKGPANSY